MLSHLSALNISAKLCQTFSHLSATFSSKTLVLNIFIEFRADFDEILSEIFSEFRHSFQTDPQAEYSRKINIEHL